MSERPTYTLKGETGNWELVMGLEVHAQVASEAKLFSGASTRFGADPNCNVSLVDAAMPGMLPVINRKCVEQAVRTGLGLKAKINKYSRFDRKNYFYPDLPQGYQISQFDFPIVGEGEIEVDVEPAHGDPAYAFTVRIERLHLEQDAGKSIHDMAPDATYVDLNRDPRELDPEMFEDELPGDAASPSVRVKAGLGCIPKIGARGDVIYAKKLSLADGRARLEGIHGPYHQVLSDEIAALRHDHGCALLIDCHSMPSKQPGRPDLPDIVLGDRFGSSCTSQLTNLVERTFRQRGLSVVRNAPYAGGYTTRRYGRPKRHVHALQIEVNRRLYMDELAVEPSPGMTDLIETVDLVISEICRLAARLKP